MELGRICWIWRLDKGFTWISEVWKGSEAKYADATARADRIDATRPEAKSLANCERIFRVLKGAANRWLLRDLVAVAHDLGEAGGACGGEVIGVQQHGDAGGGVGGAAGF